MSNPKPHPMTISYLLLRDVIKYVESKYGIKTNNYTPITPLTEDEVEEYYDKYPGRKDWNNQKPYLDFWEWVLDEYQVRNGDTIIFERGEWFPIPRWVNEILDLIETEFGIQDMMVDW